MHADAHDMAPRRGVRIGRWLVAIVLIVIVGFVVAITVRRRQGMALELAIAHVPLGISSAEADKLLGGPPDNAWPGTGVIVDGVTVLDASNPEAAKHGPISSFEVRRWRRGDVFGLVLIGEDQKVVGRLTVHDSLIRRLGLHPFIDSFR
jgi:hypothetical protein